MRALLPPFLLALAWLPPTAAPSSPPAAKLLNTLECRVSVAARQVTCQEPVGAAEGDSAARLLLGGSQVRVVFADAAYDTASGVFSAGVSVQNLLPHPIGTRDGTTADGVKVFFEMGPRATGYAAPGDTGTVAVRNAGGAARFTGFRQPYHHYAGTLQPREVSAPKRWEWTVPRTVRHFTFSLRVFAAAPGEPLVPAVAPDSFPSWIGSEWVDASCAGGLAVKDLMIVAFVAGATQEERQAAVDLVGGDVVGGSGGDTGEYYVRLRGDGTGAALCRAMDRLERLPQVEMALPDVPAPPTLDPDEPVPEPADTLPADPLPVPAEAPDSVPVWVRAAHDWGDTPCGGRAARSFLSVVFRDAAAQDERQAALDSVRGEVVGGERGGPGGTYHVRIRDDGTGGPVCRAVAALREMPQVAEARLVVPPVPASDPPPGTPPSPSTPPDTTPLVQPPSPPAGEGGLATAGVALAFPI